MSGAAHAMGRADALTSPALRPHGRLGMWLFLSGEIILFGGLIGVFVLYRVADPGWREAAAHTSVLIGTFNTLILLTSSLTMVLAHKAADDRDARRTARFLLMTIFFGLAFMVVKGFEWNAKFAHHITPAAGRFWGFYFGMTGLHALHLLAGVIVNTLIWIGIVRGGIARLGHRVEVAGLYWHFVDVVWIFLFPLFYLG